MNKEQYWIKKHPVMWFLLQKISDFLWFFAKFSNPPFGSRGSSPFLYRTVDRTALAEEKPTGHSLVHFGPGLALEHPAALERL